MSPDQLRDLKKFTSENAEFIRQLDHTTNLVHSDFNQKNILVKQQNSKWVVAAILDWEFSYSACPLGDLGNFFRFEKEMHSSYQSPLLEAYQNNGGHLVPNWQHIAKVLDLLAMLDFLTREGEYPKTFATAISVINATLYD